jgi:hypothetical protein
VELHSGLRRVDLQVKGGGFNRFLFLPGQVPKAVGECIGDTNSMT